jgi:PP-loop superfamily ATP-utilizing enzyme
VIAGIKALGYRFVTLDLEGFRSGSLNAEWFRSRLAELRSVK